MALQGGRFDKPDRLFHSIEQSWLSASSQNLQDVRELTPEFFCTPEFLVNHNKFDFGLTQKEEKVEDVFLPKWAKNNPYEFCRLHREALESKYVSENLHEWIDLIFGFKQRGSAAEEAMNVFIHLTYDGEVDVDAITDELMRDATIAQINNFGQTPSRLFEKPHPRRVVPDIIRKPPHYQRNSLTTSSFSSSMSSHSQSHNHSHVSSTTGMTLHDNPILHNITVNVPALTWHEHFTPPLCIIGAPHLSVQDRITHMFATYPFICSGFINPHTINSQYIDCVNHDLHAKVKRRNGYKLPVGDLALLKDKTNKDKPLDLVMLPKDCLFLSPSTGSKRFIYYGMPVGGFCTFLTTTSITYVQPIHRFVRDNMCIIYLVVIFKSIQIDSLTLFTHPFTCITIILIQIYVTENSSIC